MLKSTKKFKVFLNEEELITPFDYRNMDGNLTKVETCMVNQCGELIFSFEEYWNLVSDLPRYENTTSYPEIVWCENKKELPEVPTHAGQ